MTCPVVPRSPRVPVLACAVAALAPAATAQAVAGSESLTGIAQTIDTAGGVASTASQTLESTLGQTATGGVSASANFRLETGVAWAEPLLGSDLPLVHGLSNLLGDKNGGDTITVFGDNFLAPGAGAADVLLAGQFGSLTTVISDNVITTQTPPGEDLLDNPLARTELAVANTLGTDRADEPFLYGPALVGFSHARVGERYELSLYAPPASFYFIAYAGGQPSFGPLTLPPAEGTLDLSGNPVMFVFAKFTATGFEKRVLPIPNDPTLAFLPVEFQGLVLTDPVLFQGSFTNVHSFSLLP